MFSAAKLLVLCFLNKLISVFFTLNYYLHWESYLVFTCNCTSTWGTIENPAYQETYCASQLRVDYYLITQNKNCSNPLSDYYSSIYSTNSIYAFFLLSQQLFHLR